MLIAPLIATEPAAPIAAVLHVRAGTPATQADGATPTSAFATIQQALDRVQPGGTVIIHPGVYHEIPVLRTSGTTQAPITIRADAIAPDRVILTAADRALRDGQVSWRLEDEALGLYSAPFDHLPARLLYSGVDLLPYPSLDGLRSFTLLDGYPGPLHGFFFSASEERLYVRLHAGGLYGSSDPRQHRMCAAPINAPGSNGHHIGQPGHANLFIEPAGEAHVIIAGLTFETPGAAGVVTRGGAVTIRDSWFRGCRFGVFGVRQPAAITVEHCDYHQFPAFDDMAEVIHLHRGGEIERRFPIFWWHRKGVNSDSAVLKNYETGIAGGVGAGWRIAGNDIHDAFEGLSTWGVSDAVALDVVGNRFQRLIDNAVETENHSRDVRIHGNDIVDVFEPISWQPLAGPPWPGPVFVYRNRFFTSAEARSLWPLTPGCFKFGASGANWQQQQMGKVPIDEPRARISKRFVVVPDPGFLVFNNSIVFPHGHLLTIPQPIERDLINFRFFNNAMIVRDLAERPAFTGSLIEFFNNAVAADQDAQRVAIMAGPGGRGGGESAALGLRDPLAGDIAPMPGSPLLGAGTILLGDENASSDIGALAGGSTWSLAGTGPRVSGPE